MGACLLVRVPEPRQHACMRMCPSPRSSGSGCAEQLSNSWHACAVVDATSCTPTPTLSVTESAPNMHPQYACCPLFTCIFAASTRKQLRGELLPHILQLIHPCLCMQKIAFRIPAACVCTKAKSRSLLVALMAPLRILADTYTN